jgi:hypothetical protein
LRQLLAAITFAPGPVTHRNKGRNERFARDFFFASCLERFTNIGEKHGPMTRFLFNAAQGERRFARLLRPGPARHFGNRN